MLHAVTVVSLSSAACQTELEVLDDQGVRTNFQREFAILKMFIRVERVIKYDKSMANEKQRRLLSCSGLRAFKALSIQ